MKKILTVLLALGILASALVALPLDRADRAYRQVEIVVDLDNVFALAREAGSSPARMLARLQKLGVTAVGIREASLQRYHSEGRLSLVEGSALLRNWWVAGSAPPQLARLFERGDIDGDATYVLTENAELAGRIAAKARLKMQRPVRLLSGSPFYLVEIDDELDRVASLRVGVDPGDVALAAGLSLRLVPRPENLYINSPAAARETMAEFLSLPREMLSAVVFEGEEVTGYPGQIAETAAVLKEAGVPLGLVEFHALQKGMGHLSGLTGYQTLLVHPQAAERTVTAMANSVRERHVRLIYLRFPQDKREMVPKALETVGGLTKALARYGYSGGPVTAVNPPRHPGALLYVVLLGLAAAGTLLLAEVLGTKRRWLGAVLVLTFLIMASALWLLPENLALHLLSILAAGVFPSLAVISQQLNRLPGEIKDLKSSLRWALQAIVRTTLLVAAGGLLAVSLTTNPYFLGGTAQFHGVKLVHTLPLLLIGLLAALRVYYHQVRRWDAASLVKAARDLLEQPVLLSHLLLGFALAAAAFIYVGRTGHEAGIPVPDLEVRLRLLLGDLLVVRPRLKEFAIGYPAALLGLTLAARGRRGGLTALLLVLGAIAPVSVSNTFMHFTTPMPVTSALFRSFNGLWLGLLLGLGLALPVLAGLPLLRQKGLKI